MFPLSLIPCDFSSSRLPVPLTRLMHIAGGLVEQGSFAKPAHRGDIYDGKSFVLVVLQHFPLASTASTAAKFFAINARAFDY